MGTFTYNATLKITFDDRVLAHLQAVIAAKFRRHESCFFTWSTEQDGGGRTSIWLEPTIPVVFEYTSSEMPTLSRAWLEQLAAVAHTPSGLQVLPEPTLAADKKSVHSQPPSPSRK